MAEVIFQIPRKDNTVAEAKINVTGLYFLRGNIYRLIGETPDHKKFMSFVAKTKTGAFYDIPLDGYSTVAFKYGNFGTKVDLKTLPNVIKTGISMTQAELMAAISKGEELNPIKAEEPQTRVSTPESPSESTSRSVVRPDEREHKPVRAESTRKQPIPLTVYHFKDGSYIIMNASLKNCLPIVYALDMSEEDLDNLGKNGLPSYSLKYITSAQFEDLINVCRKEGLEVIPEHVALPNHKTFNVIVRDEGMFISDAMASEIGIGEKTLNFGYKVTEDDLKKLAGSTGKAVAVNGYFYHPNYIVKKSTIIDKKVMVQLDGSMQIIDDANNVGVPVTEEELQNMINAALSNDIKINITYEVAFQVIVFGENKYITGQVAQIAGIMPKDPAKLATPVLVTDETIENLNKICIDLSGKTIRFSKPTIVDMNLQVKPEDNLSGIHR